MQEAPLVLWGVALASPLYWLGRIAEEERKKLESAAWSSRKSQSKMAR